MSPATTCRPFASTALDSQPDPLDQELVQIHERARWRVSAAVMWIVAAETFIGALFVPNGWPGVALVLCNFFSVLVAMDFGRRAREVR